MRPHSIEKEQVNLIHIRLTLAEIEGRYHITLGYSNSPACGKEGGNVRFLLEIMLGTLGELRHDIRLEHVRELSTSPPRKVMVRLGTTNHLAKNNAVLEGRKQISSIHRVTNQRGQPGTRLTLSSDVSLIEGLPDG